MCRELPRLSVSPSRLWVRGAGGVGAVREDAKFTYVSLARGIKLTGELGWQTDEGLSEEVSNSPWGCGISGEKGPSVGTKWGFCACRAQSPWVWPLRTVLGLSEKCGSAACLVTPNSRSGV